VVGSISHSSSSAVAVAAWRVDVVGIGIDVEVAGAVEQELWASVLGPRERAWVETCGLPADDAATLVFSAKESLFKAQFPTTGRWLEFDDIEIRFDVSTSRFSASLDRVSGCYGSDGDEVWTLAVWGG
jgi:4'-phosphopantetheinyl transferase EntD